MTADTGAAEAQTEQAAKGSGQPAETHEELCDRYAAMNDLDFGRIVKAETKRLAVDVATIRKMRADGDKRAKAGADASSSAKKPQRPSDAEMSAAIESVLSLEGLALNLKLDEFSAAWGVQVSAVRAEHKLLMDRKEAADAKANPQADSGGKGTPLNLEPPEPWAHPVKAAELLDEVRKVFDDHLVMPKWSSAADALWTAHTYGFEAFDYTPRLSIQSPEMQCGKSKKLDILGVLCCKAIMAANISAPAMFRTIELGRPTLLIDEADSFMKENEELRGVVNSGHAANGGVIRTVGDDHEPRLFSTFAPVAIAGIGHRAATIEDRSIPTHMRRKLPADKVRRFRSKDPAYPRIRRQLARMMQDMVRGGVAGLDPKMPKSLSDRQTDSWRPLFAIAEKAGGHWPELAWNAAIELCKVAADNTQSIGVRLLSDVREIFYAGTGKPADAIASKMLADLLAAIDDAPWAEWKGKAITMPAMARLLVKYKISPATVRLKAATFKGYKFDQFSDAWARYLPPRGNTVTSGGNPPENEDLEPSHGAGCDASDFPGIPQDSAGCDGVTDSDGENSPPNDFGAPENANEDPGAVPDEGRGGWAGDA